MSLLSGWLMTMDNVGLQWNAYTCVGLSKSDKYGRITRAMFGTGEHHLGLIKGDHIRELTLLER